MLRKMDFHIDGQWVAAAGARPFEVVNPAGETAFAAISPRLRGRRGRGRHRGA